MNNKNIERIIIVIPLIISIFSWIPDGYWLGLIAIMGAFICITVCSTYCRGHEQMYMFVYAFLITIPMNAKLSLLIGFGFCNILLEMPELKLICIPVFYAFLLSIEEIVLGIIGEIVWYR